MMSGGVRRLVCLFAGTVPWCVQVVLRSVLHTALYPAAAAATTSVPPPPSTRPSLGTIQPPIQPRAKHPSSPPPPQPKNPNPHTPHNRRTRTVSVVHNSQCNKIKPPAPADKSDYLCPSIFPPQEGGSGGRGGGKRNSWRPVIGRGGNDRLQYSYFSEHIGGGLPSFQEWGGGGTITLDCRVASGVYYVRVRVWMDRIG